LEKDAGKEERFATILTGPKGKSPELTVTGEATMTSLTRSVRKLRFIAIPPLQARVFFASVEVFTGEGKPRRTKWRAFRSLSGK
jgi:hypothetical protein